MAVVVIIVIICRGRRGKNFMNFLWETVNHVVNERGMKFMETNMRLGYMHARVNILSS